VLQLGENKISKIEGLDNLTNLNKLDFSNNKIDEIRGLNSLIELEELNLSCNFIREVNGLDNLKKLSSINLGANQIFQIISLRLENLKNLNLIGNKINSNDPKIKELIEKGVTVFL
jgi:Leucine-rich repeat (LRR) protein